MRKIKYPKIGEYILATHRSDKNPNDPWFAGLVYCITVEQDKTTYRIQGSNREWQHVFRVTATEVEDWLASYKGSD